MTYKELYESAIDKLEKSKITLGEFEKMIEPLNAEIATAETDTISRQQAIDELRKCRFVVDGIEKIRGLPPTEPKRMRAKWITTTSLQEGQIWWRDYKCSNCSHHRGKPMNFCEICGAKMER